MLPSADHLVQRGLKLSHLRLLAALADAGQITQAADRIGVAQPAASRLLAEVERIVGAPVHQRTGRGMVLTPVGLALASRAQRIQIELRDAARDMAEVVAGASGHVRIGSVTGPAIDRVLPVLRSARLTAPKITVEVIVAPSDILCEHLLSGRIDFAIGRLPEGSPRDLFQMIPIAAEPVALVVRRGHPLTRQKAPAPGALMAYDWVMPPEDSILSRAVLARLRAHDLPVPPQRFSTASFLLTFALLQQSNAIAPLARAVATSFSEYPTSPYVELPIDLGIEVETFGLVTLAGAVLPPVAARLAEEIRRLTPAA
ncbi:MAG: LysR family transcriptional regulator [Rhodobacteraceae bacterium]|nr:LysR family transcriptional regulator [Paracoccaceae bacterium]